MRLTHPASTSANPVDAQLQPSLDTDARTHAVPAERARLWAWALLALAFALFAVHLWLYRGFVIDDAYITFRFVQQWIAGNGLVYNVGEYTEGYSNFLWIILLAPFAWLGIDLVSASKGLGIILSAVTLVMTWRYGRHAGLPGIAPLFLAASGPFIAWTVGGLETALFTCLVVISFYVFVQEENRDSGFMSGCWFALLALTRPEGLLFAGVAGLLRLWRLWQARRRPEPRDWLRLALLLGIVGAYFIWRWSYYGDLLPNTVYAKSMGGHPRGYLEGVYYLIGSLAVVGGLALVMLPAVFIWGTGNIDFALRTLFAACGAMALFLVLAGGDWMPLQRFTVHVLPLVFLLVEAGLVRMAAVWTKARQYWGLALVVAGQTAFLLVLSAQMGLLAGMARHDPLKTFTAATAYIEARLAGSAPVIAVTDAGALPYSLPLGVRAVDMVGLVDAHIAHLPPQFPNGLLGSGDGFGKWDVDYVLAQRPQFVEIGSLRRGEDGSWQTNFTGTQLLVNDPEFLQKYRLVEAPGVHGLFERVEP